LAAYTCDATIDNRLSEHPALTGVDVWTGAAATALLYTIGKFLIGIYLGKSSLNSAYGATGSLVVLLLWIYYSAQIFLLGAEFTRVATYEYGSRRSSARV
jgi:membrane protein